MLLLLSPAKSLDYDSPGPAVAPTQPLFMKDAAELIAVLRPKPPQEIAELMSLSDKLAALNVARFEAWRPEATPANARAAVLAFDGDVYRGLAADATPVVVNLASQEYFKAVDTKVLKARVVECVFEDEKDGKYRIISFFAKRARGLMGRWAVLHRAAPQAFCHREHAHRRRGTQRRPHQRRHVLHPRR
ncbi:MAG: YaaA family protein [Tepidimonas sp.]|uniref:YaaA family protein n=1 Tax=Tepidimonas sp. TaxID=2002775 RepID=UPI00259D4CAE|nr:YaaA family protein [Tepidimonas sp.]MDM7457193.1 YaaA family protein [Tepidimonas sp.]